MSEFMDFWRHYADFKGKTTVRGFWIAFLIWYAIAVAMLFLLGLLGLFALHLSPEEATNFAREIVALYALASFVPMLSAAVRRLRDAGYSAKSFFWLLIPVFGQIAFFARLCSKTKK